jgi:head-tail adaptor
MTASVSVGELRTRLTLEAPARTGDGGGGAAVAWEPVAVVWAAVRPLGGGEGSPRPRHGRLSEIFIRHHATFLDTSARARASTTSAPRSIPTRAGIG